MTDGPERDELDRRRERVVATVMARIAAAPPVPVPVPAAPPAAAPEPRVDFTPWRIPALAAAALVLAGAGAVLARGAAEDRLPPGTVAEALGLPAPVAHWLETGESPPLESLGGLPPAPVAGRRP